MKAKILVVGGGIGGLVAAYRLLQKNNMVTVVEKSSELGGLLGAFKIGDTCLEKSYHHIFKTDKYIIELIKELGLEKKLKWHEAKTAIYYEKKIYPFAGAIDLLKFKPLNLIDKLRLGLVKIYLEKENNWKKFENVLAYEWMKKWCGKNAYKVIWEPLLRGKFGKEYKKVSMAWMWARIHTRANSSEKGKEYLGYLDGGFQQIVDELEKRIEKLGGEIKISYELAVTSDGLKGFDKIITTAPLEEVDYLGAVTMVFTSKQNLSRYYWHNINDNKSPFLALIQHTNLEDKKRYGNKHVYYLGTYLPQNHRYFKNEDKTIEKEFFCYLKKILPNFNEEKVFKKWVFKFKYAQHVVDVGYRKKIEKYGHDKGKIIYMNFAQIYPEDRGINYAVREGERVSQKGYFC